MRPSSTVPFRPHYRPVATPAPSASSPASLITTVLVALILVAEPAVLGGARLWYELPVLVGISVLLLVQALRLSAVPAPGASRQLDAIDLSVLLFTAYAVVRWLTSPTEYYSRLEAVNVIAYATLFLTCRHGLTRRPHALALVFVLVALGLAETGFGYYLSLHSDVNHPENIWFPFGPTEQLQLHYAPRWIGTYGCPDHYVSLLVMAAGAALALGCFSKLSWPLRIVFLYGAGLMMVGIFYSQSRGGWLSLFGAIGALTFFGLRYGTMRWWLPAGGALLFAAAVAAAVAWSPLVQARVAEVTKGVQAGTVGNYFRLEIARDALRIARDHPVFGTGPATFEFVHPRYQSSTLNVKAVYTHDDYLNCLDDYGLVGFGLALFFVFAVTLALFQRVRADFRWGDRVVVATSLAAWCALVVHSFLDFNLHIPANAMLLFSLTGLGLRRLPREEMPPHWSTLPLTPVSRWLGVALLLFALGEAVELTRMAISDNYFERAFNNAETAPPVQSIDDVERALSYYPGNAEARLLLGDLYRVRALKQTDIEGRIAEGQKALAAYQKALADNPLDDTIQARRGLTFDVMRRYAEAFFCYQAAVTAQPYDGQFWSALGNHFWQRGLLQKAEESYLIAARCPHGGEGSGASAAEVRAILDQQGFPPAAPGANPLTPEAEVQEPTTVP